MIDKEGYRHMVDTARELVSEPPGLPSWQESYASDMAVLLRHIDQLEQVIDGFLVEWEPRRPSLLVAGPGAVNRAELPRVLAFQVGISGTNRLSRWEQVVTQASAEAQIAAAAQRQKAAVRRG